MNKITSALRIFISFAAVFSIINVASAQNNCLKIGQNVASMQFKDIFKENIGWRFPGRTPAAVCTGVFGAPNCPEQPFITALPKDVNGYITGGIPYQVSNIQLTINDTYTGTITSVTTYMQRESYQPYPLGDYYVFWQGQATIRFFWNDGAGMVNPAAGTYGTIPAGNGYELNFGVANNGITAINGTQVSSDASAGVHYCRITVPSTTGNPARDPYNNFAGIGMQILASAPAPNHLRGISVVQPDFGTNAGGYNGASKSIADGAAARTFVNSGPEHFKNQPFHPAYLNWLRGFPTLRFMGLLGINGEDPTDVSWLNVRSYDYYTQTARVPGIGHPVNYMYIIQLCNMLKANPWINGFVNSDENYQRNLGQLFRDNLDPTLKVYLEMSNENTWNFAPGFNGPFLINAFLSANGSIIPDNGENRVCAAAAFLENRLWKNFGSSWNGEDQDRIVRVVAGQAVNAYQAQQKALYHENNNERYDELSFAWYLDQLQTNARAIGQTGTPLQLINAMIQDNNYNNTQDSYTNFPSIAKQCKQHADLARAKGKKLALYEGGTHHSYEQEGREVWHRSKFIKWLPEIRTFYKSLLDTIRNYPEIDLAMNFVDYGGNSTLVGTAFNVADQAFGVVPTPFTDTTSTGNRSFIGLEFGSINTLGTNAHGVWKELQAQNNVWRLNPICNPTVTSDIVGSGLSLGFLSPRSQYVNVTSAALFDPLATPNYTIEAWILPQELERQQTIWAYSNGTNVLNSLSVSSLNRIQWNIGNGATILNGPIVERNKWYHVSVVKSGTSVQMYVNGSLATSGSASGSAGVPTNCTLGASNAGSLSNFLRGQIDEFKVWNSAALTQTLVRDFMCKKVTPTHPNYAALSTYIEFNSIAGTNLMDRKTGLAHGTLVNFGAPTISFGYLQSGAPIGDLSTNIYPGSWANTGLSFTNPVGGDVINISDIGGGNPDGAHIYVVNERPTLNTNPQFYTTLAGKYFGVFFANGTNPTYNVNYNFQGNSFASSNVAFNRLVKREAGSDFTWDNSGARIDALNRRLITNCSENYRAEYILGIRQNILVNRPGSGACISLSGTSIGTFNSFNRPDVYTIAFWARGSDGMLGFSDPFTGREIGYYPTNSSNFVARYGSISLGNQNQMTGGFSSAWTHYTYTRDANGLFVYYVNGYPTSSISFPADTGMVDMFIGRAHYSPNYVGQLDELSVWKRNLSLTEIRDLMCKKITPAHPSYCDLYAYFKFDEATGRVMENTLGAGNLVFNNNIGWARSGAAIGDESDFNYNSPYTARITHPEGDFAVIRPNNTGNLVGSQIYYNIGDPNYPIFPSTETYSETNRDTSRYYGVFAISNDPTGGSSRSYTYEYNYQNNSNINPANEANLRLMRRENNEILNWTSTGVNPVVSTKTLTFQSPVRNDAHYPKGEFMLGGINPSPFVPPLNGIPTVAGITGKTTLCLGESNALYRILATVDRRALSFRWTASNGLALTNSTSDTINVTALTAGLQTLTVVGVNRFGSSTPPTVYTINVQNTGYLSTNIVGNLNPCNSSTETYNVSGVSPSPIAYIWSVTGDAINPTPSNLTASNAFNFGNAGQSTVRISVYGQYSCGLALINTLNVRNNALPNTTLNVIGDSLCAIDGNPLIDIKVSNSQNGVTYTAFDGVTPVGSISGNGLTQTIKVPTSILTTFVNKVITVRAQNNLCPLIPVTMAMPANLLMGNTLTGAQLSPTFANPGAICYNLNNGNIRDFPLNITSGAVSGATYTPNYLTFAQPYGEPFEYKMGAGVLATGSAVSMLVQPASFPYWLSFNVPNSISGLVQAPGCPTQRLITRTTFTLNNTPEVAVPSKVTGPGKGLRAPGDQDYPVCTGTPTSYFTTAKGGSITQFNQRYFDGAMTNGSQDIVMSNWSNMTAAQIAVNDVVYIVGTQTDGSGLPGGNNLPQLTTGSGDRIPYFVVNVAGNNIRLSTTRGGAAITLNFNDTGIRFWAPITIDITGGSNTFTIPARFGTLGLGLYSQINFDYAWSNPGGVCVGSSGGSECHAKQYVASINGNNIQLSVNQMQLNKSAGYYLNRGTFTYTAGSTNVIGTGTRFQDEDLGDNNDGRGGAILRDINNNFIGEVASVTNQGVLTLKAGAIGSGTNAIVSSSKRIRFTSNGESVVLSAPQDGEPTGFEWTVGPREAIVNVTSFYGGGTYNPATGVFSGGNSDALKNGITITWNGTFAGTANVAVTSSKLTPCFAKSTPQALPATPGYQQTDITLVMQRQIPTNPTPIGFTDLSFCQSQSNTSFVTGTQNATGGFQWQLLNAGTSRLRYTYNGGPCQWSPTSTVVGHKAFQDVFGTLGFGGDYMGENTAPCQNSTQLDGAPHGSNNTVAVQWQPGYTGLATIRVRSLGCGTMSDAGDMRASPWVTAVITIGGSPNPGNINLNGQLQLCQGSSPSQQYIASGTNIDEFKYFLRRPGQSGDIDPGLIAYYSFDGSYVNTATGIWSLGSAVNGTPTGGVSFVNNKNGTTTSAILFTGGSRVSLGTDNRLALTNSFSVSAWVNVTSGNGTYSLYSRGGDWQESIMLLINVNGTNGRLGVFGNSGTFNVDDFGAGGSFIGANFGITGWKHVSFTGNFAAGVLVLTGYVDGVLLGTINVPYNGAYLGNPGEPTRIGGFSSFGNFNGGIDEVMVHNRVLNPADVAAIYALDAARFIDPSDYIGEINGNTGLATWQTTFAGPAQIGVQAIGCGGSTIRTFDAFISPKPSILGISIADPTGCGNPLASGSITITLASFNPLTFTGTPWAISWNNDLISDGSATLTGANTITLNNGLFAGSSVTGITTWYNGSLGCNAPTSLTSRIIVGSSPPSSLIGTSLMSAPQVCTASTSSGINVLGSENNVRYYAMIGGLMVTPTVVGTGGNIQLSITGANILTATGLNQVYQIRTMAFSPGCSLVTLAGIQTITVNGASAATGAIVTGTNPVCSPATSVVSVGGVNGTIDWQVSTVGVFASTGGTVANYTTPSLSQTSTFRALVTNGACPAVTTTSVVITVNSPITTTFAYNQPAYCNNVTTSVSAILSNTVAGGVFTVAPSGLSLNATTGAVTVNTSSAALYTVTYSYTVPGCPALTTTTSVQIGSIPGLAIGFFPTTYCSSSPNPTPGTTFSGLGSGGTFSSTSAGLVFVSNSSGQVNLLGSSVGTYPLIYTVSVVGCGNVTSTVGNAITINSVTGASISYVSPVCNTSSVLTVTALNTIVGGVYSASGGLTINSSNGTINPLGFGGTYTITYSYTVPGCGPQVATTTLGVTTLPSTPILSYGAAPICSSASPVNLVSSTNAVNGSFLSTATGFSVNATNGQITIPQNTLAGVFTVRYDIPAGGGCASVSGNNTITLTGVPNALTITGVTGTQCFNSSHILTAIGTIPGTNIEWRENGIVSGSNAPSFTTSSLTSLINTYFAIVNNGVCQAVTSTGFTININQNPTVTGIASTQSFACTSQSVSLSNTGLVGSIVYAVNTGAGFNLLPSNGYTFANTITGNAFSFVGYAFVAGCQTVSSPVIIVNSSLCGLTAAFSSNPTPICISTASSTGVVFTNNSSSAGGTILGYVWNFGADANPASTVIGVNSTNYTINVTYTTSGPKNITLSILGTGGLTSTISGQVNVDALSTISGISIPVSPICETNSSEVLSVTALGTIQWYKAGVAQGTLNTQAAGAMTANTTFMATAVNGVCPMVTSTGVVTVTNLNVGGTITGASAICASSPGLNLTLASQVGTTYNWYSSTNTGTTWTLVPSSTNTGTIPTGTLSTTTSYVVSISGGACPNAASNIATINVTQTPIGGTASVDRMVVCTSDGNGGIYTLASHSGSSIQWERSTDNFTFVNATGTNPTSATFIGNNLGTIGNVFYRARVSNAGACGDVFSNVITVSGSICDLQAAFTPNSTTVCVSVGNVVTFTDASTTSNTILGYTWDFADGTGGTVNTAGPHVVTFASPGLKNIRLTILGLGGLTNIATGTVQVDETSNAGSISTPSVLPICYNTTANLNLNGSLGSIQWYSTSSGMLGSTTSILGTNNLTTGDGYFATVKNGVCPMVTTSGFTVNVLQEATVTGYTIPAGNICLGTDVVVNATGITGSVVGWETSDNNSVWSSTTYTGSSFTITQNLDGSQYYRAIVQNGAGCQNVTVSSSVLVTATGCAATVSFTGLPTALCSDNATIPANTIIDRTESAATITNWFWDFGQDANPRTSSAQTQPIVNYTTSGVKTITLLVTITGGNSFTSATTSGLSRTITVDQRPEASFSYLNNNYCENFGDVNIALGAVLTSGGTFFASGLSFTNSPNGTFNTGGQTGGPYNIQYAIPSTAGCNARTVTGTNGNMTIRSNPNVNAISYSTGNVFCNSNTITGNATANSLGSYFATPTLGANINSGNGNITLSNSVTPGNYTITYSIAGSNNCASVSSSTGITVKANPSQTPFTYDLPSRAVICNTGSTGPASRTGGTYFTNSTQITINPLNGSVSESGNSVPVGTSTPYTVFFILTESGYGCISATTQNTVTISKQHSVPQTFGYNTSLVGVGGQMCNEGFVNVNTVLSGLGTYSIEANFTSTFVIPQNTIDSQTGRVDLSKLIEGGYTVRYTVPAISVNNNNVCDVARSSATFNTTSSGTAFIFQGKTGPKLGACQGDPKLFELNPALFNPEISTITWSERVGNGPLETIVGRNLFTLANHTMIGTGLHVIQGTIQNGQCAAKSDFVEVNVDEYPIGGVVRTIDPQDTLLCYAPDTRLTITGFRGDVFEWEFYKKQILKNTPPEFIPAEGSFLPMLAFDNRVSTVTSPAFIIDDDYKSQFFIRAKITNGACKRDANGNEVFASQLRITKCAQDVFIPNALTPDAGGENSFWDIKKLRLPENVTVTIFNRYGVEVYVMTGKDLQDDTKQFNGGGLPAGTYYYVIDFKGTAKNIQGDLTIVR